ncbi:hypothetical protein V8G54_005282 [Vigna mungo]|uniref:Secreted protein n=1 Tax=Vigna mungo TaxID=3915 RepID=A0AAQ3NY13_VIGMU
MPVIVCVFPLLVCPYAKMLELTPLTTERATSLIPSSYTCFVLHFSPNTLSKVYVSIDRGRCSAWPLFLNLMVLVETHSQSDTSCLALSLSFKGLTLIETKILSSSAFESAKFPRSSLASAMDGLSLVFTIHEKRT